MAHPEGLSLSLTNPSYPSGSIVVFSAYTMATRSSRCLYHRESGPSMLERKVSSKAHFRVHLQ